MGLEQVTAPVATTAALASGASGQRGDSMARAHSASEDARERAGDTRPEPGSSARAERLQALHRDMADDIRATHALRLGFRKIKGLSEAHGKAIMQNRGAGFASVRDLWLRTGLVPHIIERLADADAFGSLGLTQRQALWAAK